MGLLEELKEQREEAIVERELQEAQRDMHQINVDEWAAKIADLDRAIAALTPAPDAPVSGDGEIEIPEGFTKWDEYSWGDADRGKPITLLFDDGSTVDTEFGSGNGGKSWKLRIVAFKPRILSEPAGEGETTTHATVATSTDTKTVSVAEGYAPVVDAEPAPVALGEIAPHAGQLLYEPVPDEPFSIAEVEAEEPHVAESDAVKAAVDAIVASMPLPELGSDTVGTQTYVDGDQLVVREITAREFFVQPDADLPPLFPPEPPKAATPEQLEAAGVIDSEAGWWARKMTKVIA